MRKVKSVRVFYDAETNTLDVWFDNPDKEVFCDETEDEIILKKDKAGKVIGFEKLNFLASKIWKKNPQVEVIVA